MASTGKILVYGATGGVGSAIARRLAARGQPLHLVARDDARTAALAAELGATHSVADVADPQCFARVTAEAGEALDGLVYAVGTLALKPLARLTEADALHDYRINALGAALAVQAATAALKRSAGSPGVVLFSSIAASQGFASHASIAMAKGAVEGLTLALAAELAPKVRVNAIAPSLTRTPLAQSLTGNETLATAIAGLHAVPRLGEPEDIAAVANLLLSAEASWMTGQVIAVDGGRSSVRTKG